MPAPKTLDDFEDKHPAEGTLDYFKKKWPELADVKIKTLPQPEESLLRERFPEVSGFVKGFSGTAPEKHLNDPLDAPLFSPEHHGIYDNYTELAGYLKNKLGGTEHVDKFGHTWIEVPTRGEKSPVKSGRMEMFQALPFTMAGAYPQDKESK